MAARLIVFGDLKKRGPNQGRAYRRNVVEARVREKEFGKNRAQTQCEQGGEGRVKETRSKPDAHNNSNQGRSGKTEVGKS